MHEHLPKRPNLLIVSDTMMIRTEEGVIAFEPVVRELENFEHVFDRITWIGFGYPIEEKKYSVRKAANPKIRYIMLPRVGGKSILDKLKVYWMMPYTLFVILYHLKGHEVVHTRGPSMPAFLAVLVSFVIRSKTYWHKFAGNWGQESPPRSYGLQRSLLKKATHTHVTVNGKWPGQEPHVLSFENPCVTNGEYAAAKATAGAKDFSGKLNFCFVGRLEDAKGVQRILDAFQNLKKHPKVGTLHFIGDGEKAEHYKRQADAAAQQICFHGFLSRKEIDEIYGQSHFILLPSTASEGFPKVIAEAAAYGCIPIVSDVSSIPQYVRHLENGFVWNRSSDFGAVLRGVFETGGDELARLSVQAVRIAEPFTYEHYNQRIRNEICKGLRENRQKM